MTHGKRYIVEARDHDGSLITEPGKQPPFAQASLNSLYDYYFECNPKAATADYEKMRDWYESKGWFFRERTW